MLVAIVVTKTPILFGASFGPFELRELSSYGFWSMVHEMRMDFVMFPGIIFLLKKGGGKWFFDQLSYSDKDDTLS